MKQKISISLFLALIVVASMKGVGQTRPSQPAEKTLGIYAHQHWSYNHPYAARTWTFEDWVGYMGGIRQLGYNHILIWPMLETMPEPLTASDQAQLEKISRVIDVAHRDYNMKVSIVLCPNVSAKNEEAAKYTFADRPFFHTDDRVDPGDPVAFGKLMAWREKLFAPLAKADGLFIIDSDPGGYPNSTNMEFVYILGAHRRMLDRLREGIQLDYWALAGWEAYSKYYASGELVWGTEDELRDAVSLIARQNYEPWGVASHRGPHLLDTLGMEQRVLSFPYGMIEWEPSFPLTIYGTDRAYEGGKMGGPRGIMGNAQTHCVQLPNTFAFARGAQGLSLGRSDFVNFANDLILGQGQLIVDGWEALNSEDPKKMRKAGDRLARLQNKPLEMGPLKGLLFNDSKRFLSDLVLQLRMVEALYELRAEVLKPSFKNAPVKKRLRAFADAADTWQQKTGYSNRWNWEPLDEALRSLNSEEINTMLYKRDRGAEEGGDPFENVKTYFKLIETFTPRLISEIRNTAEKMP